MKSNSHYFKVGDRVYKTSNRYTAAGGSGVITLIHDDSPSEMYNILIQFEDGNSLYLGASDIELDKNKIVTDILNDL